MNYTVTVKFSTDHDTDEHLQTKQATREEVQSWLESLRAVGTAVTVEESLTNLETAATEEGTI